MTHVVRAELLRLVHRRSGLGLLAASALFAAVIGLSIYAGAADTPTGPAARRSGASVASLSGTGGGTEAFVVGASFVGFFVFVTVIALMASDLSGGTFRTLAQREPRRARLLAGKLAGVLMVAAGVVVAAETLTFVASLALAPIYDVPTAGWISLASLSQAAADAGTVLAGVAGWSVFATLVAVVFRSVPVALAAGFGWAGPFENIVSESWSPGYRWFPGQVLAALIRGGNAELGRGRAAVTAAAYAAVAGAAALWVLCRRDVTA